MSQGRSIIDIIQDPAALESFLRSSTKSSTNSTGSQRLPTNTPDQNRLTTNINPTNNNNNTNNNIYNQNTTNNTNVQITQNTFNFNTNPSLITMPQQAIALNDSTRVLNQNIGSQTNVNVILNQTVIQQQQPTVQTTNQQQMVAININGNQTLIPLSMFTKLLQQKYSSTQQSTIPSTTVTQQVAPTQIIQNGTGPIPQPNSSNTQSTVPTTLRFVRPSTTTTTTTTTTTNCPASNLMMMTGGPRLSTPILSKPHTGNIIVQVASNDTIQSKLLDKTVPASSNSDLTTQLMNDLQSNGKDPEKQITLIDTYLSRMQSTTEKDREFSTRIIRYRETLSQSVEQARINGQHRQRLLDQSTTLNTLLSNPSIKRETPGTTQQKSNGTTLIQLPLAKQDELLNAVLKKLRHVNLPDLQTQGILPMELTFEQKLQIQKLDMQIAALPIDKQQQFARGQRELVPKYLAKHAATGLNTTTTLTVNPRTKILLGTPSASTALINAANNNTRSLRISSADLIGQQLRKDQAHVLKPDFKSRFLTRGDAIKRLTRYHVFTKPAPPAYEPTDDECQQFDESFEIEAKRLLAASERLNVSISRFAVANDRLNNDTCDKYLFEKMRLDDLREQLEVEKVDYDTRKRRALDVENRPISVPILDEGASPPPSTYDFLSNASNYNLGAAMSEADYNDLFNSDHIPDETIRTSDETQLAINSIVDCGVIEQHENPTEVPDSANFFFDDLDIDNHQQDNNQSQDDEASRAVQNLLGFS
ncbi:unnamed protein product [Rotaria socialis]|uniref:GLTSCR protein conserved domain-containing protein n=1 Tax=Rotaria socialis TaxID=392032 RepID=A0A817YN91_9BILA|nr:unnamed protein product [Rotaria socialis]CAF3382444.1 unnamed protein product [Rotaria socialis]CAF3518526.1 unnamed protein product [Rotaria socialis]CAF3631292.1 unnamed protein product [Rotaria socialis]CAF3727687.1 unnamed protein product [Rotaria socialis]